VIQAYIRPHTSAGTSWGLEPRREVRSWAEAVAHQEAGAGSAIKIIHLTKGTPEVSNGT